MRNYLQPLPEFGQRIVFFFITSDVNVDWQESQAQLEIREILQIFSCKGDWISREVVDGAKLLDSSKSGSMFHINPHCSIQDHIIFGNHLLETWLVLSEMFSELLSADVQDMLLFDESSIWKKKLRTTTFSKCLQFCNICWCNCFSFASFNWLFLFLLRSNCLLLLHFVFLFFPRFFLSNVFLRSSCFWFPDMITKCWIRFGPIKTF